ncbi:MAG: fasciclin domain-containing protein [Bacteroidota bacterium]
MKSTLTVFRWLLTLLIVGTFISCKTNDFGGKLELEKNNKSILAFLNNDPAYSILRRALDTTEISGLLNVYGSVTLFAPTNDAFNKYFKRKNISGLSQLSLPDLKDLLQYHLYAQAYGSSFFLTGTLPATTVEGDYIRMDISNGLKNTLLNNTVPISKLDVPVTNGVVHVIDDVLEPPVNTLSAWIKSQPQYSIMAEALEKTGVDLALLNTVEYDNNTIVYGRPLKKMKTIFLETNDVLKEANINSFDDLARKYSNSYNTTKAYSSLADSLNIFVRYHVINKGYFVSGIREEIVEASRPGDFLIFNITGGITINKRNVTSTVNGVPVTRSVSVGLNLANSNIVAKNGVVNSVSSVLSVYNPQPVKVSVRYIPTDLNITLMNGTKATFSKDWMQSVGVRDNPAAQVGVPWLKWYFTNATMNWDAAAAAFGADLTLKYNKSDKVTPADPYWLELTTPQVFKGKYDVYLIYAMQNANLTGSNMTVENVLFTFDGNQLGDLVNLFSGADAFGNLLPNGLKNGQRVERKLGTVTFTELKSHTFKTDVLSTNSRIYFHSLEFRPTN